MRFKSRSRALVGSALAASVGLAGLTIAASPASAAHRLAGVDRFETAVEIALDTCDADGDGLCTDDVPVTDVTLVNGLNFPDALASASLGELVLLTTADEVPQVTLDGMQALGVTDVTIVGGTAVVSNNVVGQLVGEGYNVAPRIAGVNRVETSVQVGAATAPAAGGTVYLASSQTFADALAVGPLAAEGGTPILLTDPSTLSPAVLDFLLDYEVQEVVIIGGTAAVSEDVEAALGLFDVSRVAGVTRYSTATAVAGYAISEGIFTAAGRPSLATGQNFPDALAGGPFAAIEDGPLLLTPTAALGDDAAGYLSGVYTGAPVLPYLLGGTAALSAQVDTDVTDIVRAPQVGTIWDPAAAAILWDSASGMEFGPFDSATATDYVVDTAPVSKGVFDAALSAGDTLTVTYSGTDVIAELTNNDAPISGLVGEIDTTTGTFAFITAAGNPINTITIATDFDAAVTYTGAADDAAEFLTDISIGDTVTLTDADADDDFDTVDLADGSVSGDVEDIAIAAPVYNFSAGGLGDVPAEDAATDGGLFEVNTGTNQVFAIGTDPATVDQFKAALDADDADSVDDVVTYSRTNGVESFTLEVNTADADAEVAGSFSGIVHDNSTADNILFVAFGGNANIGLTEANLTDPAGAYNVLGDGDDTFTVTYDGVGTTFAELEDTVAKDAVEDIAPFGHVVVFTDTDGADTLAVTPVTTTPALPVQDNGGDGAFVIRVVNAQVTSGDADSDLYSSGAGATIEYTVNGADVDEADFEAYLVQTDLVGDRLSIDVTASATTYNLTTDETI